MKKNHNTRQIIAFMGLVLASLSTTAQTKPFHLIEKTSIGGEGGWDYLFVDEPTQQLYISHGSQVEVLDIATHKKVGVISNTMGVHGIVVVPGLGKGYTTNGKTNTATLFDTKTWKSILEIQTGKKPDALLYDTFSGHVFIFNNDGSSATVIEAATGKIISTVELGGAPESGVSDEKGFVFVNLEDTNEIVSIDVKSLTVKSRWSIAPGEEPTGLAMDRETHRLFSVCHNELMMVVDADNGKIIAQLPIGKHVDGAIFDPVAKVAISSNGEGTITVVREVSPTVFKVEETVKTEAGARTIAYNSKTQHIFLSTAQYGPTPAATTENPKPRPSVIPGTFVVLEFGR